MEFYRVDLMVCVRWYAVEKDMWVNVSSNLGAGSSFPVNFFGRIQLVLQCQKGHVS